jgi:hypothetical protein
MQTLQVLQEARQLIQDHWTPDCPRYGEDEYCIITALTAASGRHEGYVASVQIVKSLTSQSLPAFNKSHSHEEVLALFDRAIEKAKSNG